MSRVIGIVSGKGGVGKTTLALNLGASLSHHFKKRTTVVDCNLTTSHLGMSLGLYYWPNNLTKVLKGELGIVKSLYRHHSGMNVLPASMRLDELDGVDFSDLYKVVKKLEDDNDIIILDAGPGLGREAQAAINACNEVLFVTNPTIPAVMDVVRTNEVIKRKGKKVLGIVMNMSETGRHELTKEEVESLTELPVIASIPFDKQVMRSLAAEEPVVLFDKNARSSRRLVDLSANIAGVPHKIEEGFFSFLKRFFFR